MRNRHLIYSPTQSEIKTSYTFAIVFTLALLAYLITVSHFLA